MIFPRMPAPLVRTVAWAATLGCASVVSPTPASAQSQAEVGVGSSVRVVHTRCVLCLRRTSEGSIAAMTKDSMQIARTRGLTGVALRDVRWIGTPAPISHTNGAIAGAQQGLVWGVPHRWHRRRSGAGHRFAHTVQSHRACLCGRRSEHARRCRCRRCAENNTLAKNGEAIAGLTALIAFPCETDGGNRSR